MTQFALSLIVDNTFSYVDETIAYNYTQRKSLDAKKGVLERSPSVQFINIINAVYKSEVSAV